MEIEVDELMLFWCETCGAIKGHSNLAPADPVCCDVIMKAIWTRVDETNRFGEQIGNTVRTDIIRGVK